MAYTGALWSGTKITRNPLSSFTSRNSSFGSFKSLSAGVAFSAALSPKHMASPAASRMADLRFTNIFTPPKYRCLLCTLSRLLSIACGSQAYEILCRASSAVRQQIPLRPEKDPSSWNSLNWVAVRVNLVNFTEVQLDDSGLDLAHISDDHPYEMAGLDILLGHLVGTSWCDRHSFLGVRVVIVFRQFVLQNPAVSSGELLDTLERS